MTIILYNDEVFCLNTVTESCTVSALFCIERIRSFRSGESNFIDILYSTIAEINFHTLNRLLSAVCVQRFLSLPVILSTSS